MTIFIALTAVAVLMRTGILVSCFLSAKLTRQANHVMDVTRNLFGPLQNMVENLQFVTAHITDISSRTLMHLG